MGLEGADGAGASMLGRGALWIDFSSNLELMQAPVFGFAPDCSFLFI